MSGMMDAAERLARLFHETYERLAPTFFYVTRPESRVPFDELPQPNRALMIATAKQILDTNQLDSVPLLKEAHRTAWRGKDQHYWFARLVQEVAELGSALVGDHHHSPDEELAEITSICMNWLDMRRQMAIYEAIDQIGHAVYETKRQKGAIMKFGGLRLDGVQDDPETGPVAVIIADGIDGNFADVYGETIEDAEAAARYVINAVNSRLLRDAHQRALAKTERCPICGALPGEPCDENE